MKDEELIDDLLNNLKMHGCTIKDEPFIKQGLGIWIKEARSAGNLGRQFLMGLNSGLTQAADAVGWETPEARKWREYILNLKVLVKKDAT